jgi:hypothetical protein
MGGIAREMAVLADSILDASEDESELISSLEAAKARRDTVGNVKAHSQCQPSPLMMTLHHRTSAVPINSPV